MSTQKLVFIYALGLLTTALSLVGGAPFFRLLYTHTKAVYFASLILLTAAASYALGGTLLSASLLVVGFLVFMYERLGKMPFVSRIFWTLTASFALASVFVGEWMRQMGPEWAPYIKGHIDTAIQAFPALKQLGSDVFVLQLPSGIFISLMLALFLALLVGNKRPLYNYSNPSWLVWVFLASMVGSFVHFPSATQGESTGVGRVLSSNALNMLLVFYFFQGLAVVSSWFRRYKIGLPYRVFLYVLIVLQLLIVVSMLGLVDYWLEFRKPRVKPLLKRKK